MATISLCMIVKNEEAVLARCLDSIADLMDEIIIVDTGSTDHTKEIAAKYTSQIYDFKWTSDFSAARNFSFSKANMDYIYTADADEVLDDFNHERFLRLKNALLPEIEIVQMKYVTDADFDTVLNAKKELAEKVNSVITQTYWTIGKYIVEFEQDGNVKAAYGSKLLTTLSHQLTLRLGRGYSRPNLNNMRKFYLCYENCQTVSDKLTWSHICELIKIDDELERVI